MMNLYDFYKQIHISYFTTFLRWTSIGIPSVEGLFEDKDKRKFVELHEGTDVEQFEATSLKKSDFKFF